MPSRAERTEVPFGVSGVIMPARSKACGRFPLTHTRAAVAFLMNMKAMLALWQAGELRRGQQTSGCIGKADRPYGSADACGADQIYRGLRGCAERVGARHGKEANREVE